MFSLDRYEIFEDVERSHRLWVVVLALAWLLMMLSPTPTSGDDWTTDRDSELEAIVDTELLIDDGTDSRLIEISARDGVVTLLGTVPHLLAKERAVLVTERVRGVRAIVDRLELEPPEVDDAVLAERVRQALRDDPVADGWEIQIGVERSSVILDGEVESASEKRLTELVVEGVAGVRAVENRILVANVDDRADAELAAEIEGRLASDVWVDDYLIETEIVDGHVTVVGTVGSLAEKRRAVELAQVAGVVEVDASALEVDWWAYDRNRRTLPRERPRDDSIEAAVADALLYDPRLDGYGVDISVTGAVVTLTGTVEDRDQRRAAGEDAANAYGVKRVTNRIEIEPADALEQDS